MIVMILERMTPALRGELTRWLIEPHTGIFVGHINAMVRERLWLKCCELTGTTGGVVQIWSTNTEQRFAMRMYGMTQRSIIELEGLQLVSVPNVPEVTRRKVKARVKRDSVPPNVEEN